MMLYGLLSSWPMIFLLGMVSVPIFKAVLPLIQRQVQATAQEAWQDVEDIAAEAQAELDRRERGNGAVS